jgi:hypothetical protein
MNAVVLCRHPVSISMSMDEVEVNHGHEKETKLKSNLLLAQGLHLSSTQSAPTIGNPLRRAFHFQRVNNPTPTSIHPSLHQHQTLYLSPSLYHGNRHLLTYPHAPAPPS